jgi:hypothetical protein
MIKKIAQIATILGLVGSVPLTTSLDRAFALPTEQVLKTLQPVPVFTITDSKSMPLFVTDPKDKTKRIGLIFITQEEANKFYAELQKHNPAVAQKAKISLVSLGEVYKIVQNQQNQPNSLTFSYIPDEKEVAEAKKIDTNNGTSYAGGVPLFVARGDKDQGYLTIQDKDRVVVPMFFDNADLQRMLDNFKKEKPDQASGVKTEVVPLEGLMNTLKEKNDDFYTKIILIPSASSIKAVESLQGHSPAPSK